MIVSHSRIPYKSKSEASSRFVDRIGVTSRPRVRIQTYRTSFHFEISRVNALTSASLSLCDKLTFIYVKSQVRSFLPACLPDWLFKQLIKSFDRVKSFNRRASADGCAKRTDSDFLSRQLIINLA